ncbi:DMT family transporter, partial [Micromonospora sp. NPDC049580]|uniref:DMT family transporter n=1 Tax=Micromonospora sp. NPDC049580 TaxID=3154832 RepID=UPI003441FE5E
HPEQHDRADAGRDQQAAEQDDQVRPEVAAVVAVLAWNTGVQRLGAANAALFMNLVPVTTFVVQIARGYRPEAIELVGAAITIAALVAANLATRARTRSSSLPRPTAVTDPAAVVDPVAVAAR